MSSCLICFSVFFPILMGIVLVTPAFKNKTARNAFAMAVTVITSASVITSALAFSGVSVEVFSFAESFRISFKIDGLSKVFAVLVSILWPLAMLYTFEYMEREERVSSFLGFYIMTFGAVAGIAFSSNLFSMYIFYETLTLVTFPLVMHPMTVEARKAARAYLVYSFGGAAFGFIGVIFAANYCGTLEFTLGGLMKAITEPSDRGVLLLIFVVAFCGFSVKAAMFPFSGWLIKAHVAPTPVTALLHAVAVVKAGAFATMRLTYYVFGPDFLRGTWAQYTVMALALFTIVYGSTMAVKEQHFKKRLAYSTISNLSYILFGVTMMSSVGLVAALSHLVFHAVMKICSFFCAGIVMHSADKHYVDEFDMLGRRMPVTFSCFTVAGLALTGIPPLAGFISKWYLGLAAVEGGRAVAFVGIGVLMYSALMTAIYMLEVSVRAFFPKNGKKCEGFEDIKEPGWKMLLPITVFALCVVALGLFSTPLINFFESFVTV